MDGLLLEDGTFIQRNTLHHIDMVRQFYPNCKSEIEAIEKYNCILVCEYRNLHSGIHNAENDYLLIKQENGANKIAQKQMDFLLENINELTLSQIIQVEELAKLKNVNIYDFCYECLHYEKRYKFIKGKEQFDNYKEQYNYYMSKYSPNDYCENCKECKKRMEMI